MRKLLTSCKIACFIGIIFCLVLDGCGKAITTQTTSTKTTSAITAPATTATVTVTSTTTISTSTTTQISTTTSNLSEQPDKATFQQYFTEMYFGKIPAGATDPTGFQKNASVFSSGDQIALFFNSTQEVLVGERIYDVQAMKVVKEGGFPKPLKGSNGGWAPLDVPTGKYEYKVYANNVLVAIFPFEVR